MTPRVWSFIVAVALGGSLHPGSASADEAPQDTASEESRPEASEDTPSTDALPEASGQTPPENVSQQNTAPALNADDADDLAAALAAAEDEVSAVKSKVESASRRSEAWLKSPAAVTVIRREDLDTTGMSTIADVLRRVPSMQVIRSAPGNYIVSVRGTGGLQGNNIIVLLNGMPLNSPVDASVNWAGIPIAMQDIDRIEVVRGPVNTIYGPNAYTGVVNIITKRPTEERLHAAVSLSGGLDLDAHPAVNGAASMSGTFKRFSWQVAADGRRSALLSVDAAGNDLPPLIGAGASVGLQYTGKQRSTLRLEWLGSLDARSGADHLVLSDAKQTTRMMVARLIARMPERDTVISGGDLCIGGSLLGIDAPSEGFSYDGTTAETGNVGGHLRLRVVKPLLITLSADTGITRVDAPYLHPEENARIRPSYGAGLEANWDVVEPFLLSAGVRGDNSSLAGRWLLSYRASAVFHKKQWSVRLSGASAFREPSYIEVGGRFVDPESDLILLEGNANLSPPRIDSVELGVLAEIKTVTIRPTVFAARLDDLIVEDFAPLVRKSFQNAKDEYYSMGAELETDWRVTRDITLLLNLSGIFWLGETSRKAPAADENSTFSGMLGLKGYAGNNRWRYGLNTHLATGRYYNLRAGIPPVILTREVPVLGYIDASLGYRLLKKYSFWGTVKAMFGVPFNDTEGPFPSDAVTGGVFWLGLMYNME